MSRSSSRPSLSALLAAATAAVVAVSLSACAGGSADGVAASGDAGHPIRIGVVDSAKPYWTVFTKAAKDAGITVKLVNFTDYQLPNQGLAEGDLDLNQFQHLQFLSQYNVKTNSDLTPIGATAVYPLGLYSKKHQALDEFTKGGEVAIPNDDTNQARALLVLQAAGLLKLKDGGNSFSRPGDVIASESKVKVTPVDAAQTALALADVDGAVINNDYLVQADLTAQDALYKDDPDSASAEPYINVWVARATDQNNPTFKKLIEIYHSAAVEAAAREVWGDAAVFKNNSGPELEKILAGIQDNLKAAQG